MEGSSSAALSLFEPPRRSRLRCSISMNISSTVNWSDIVALCKGGGFGCVKREKKTFGYLGRRYCGGVSLELFLYSIS